jgi:hypothetical protein
MTRLYLYYFQLQNGFDFLTIIINSFHGTDFLKKVSAVIWGKSMNFWDNVCVFVVGGLRKGIAVVLGYVEYI